VESGRRKLILADFTLFTYFWDPQKIPEPTVVYVGAAPGIHIPFISKCFPQIKKFELYDPAEFKVESTEKIQIHQEFFTDKLAETYRDRKDVIFISDIRGHKEKDMPVEIFERDILIPNMRDQARWYQIMTPPLASLKFRLPYYKQSKSPIFEYLPGTIVKQVWTGYQSTETRLIPSGTKMIDYNLKWYEEAMFYHNALLRNEIQVFANPLEGKKKLESIDGKELLNDFDSVYEAIVLRDYIIKYSGKYKANQVVALTRAITTQVNKMKKKSLSMRELRAIMKKSTIPKELPEDPKQISVQIVTDSSNYCKP
jgi:hypothetical protein